MRIFILGAALALLASSAAATQAEDDYQDIEVIGMSNPYRLTPTQLKEAVEAYQSGRALYAPDAPLRFEVFGYRNDPDRAALRFRLLADDGDAIPVTLDPDGRFMLPPVDFTAKGYALQANRKSGAVRVRAYILSPTNRDDDLSVGDLRLLCRVNWAMMRPTVSVFIRGMLGTVGGLCQSSKVGFYYQAQRPLSGGTIVNGASTTQLSISKTGASYRLPVYDKALPNEARVRLTYK